MRLEVLHVPNCPNLETMLERLHEVTDLSVTTHEIDTEEEAAARGMTGSPTLLIDGIDPFATPSLETGVSCRVYRDARGRTIPSPSLAQLREAIYPPAPAAVLSAWRTTALPLDAADRTAHQAILRAFAATGRPPTRAELADVTAEAGRSTTEVLESLHEVDAIRLAPDGHVAVAYPFSASPTRHKVRIDDQVDAYAMCAIDALGISAMLDADIEISSVDVTTDRRITVTITNGQARWDPAGTVVFIGADSAGGPSVDCCCGYLNFFSDAASAEHWATSNPHVPGQILNQTEAAQLAIRLFQSLLVI